MRRFQTLTLLAALLLVACSCSAARILEENHAAPQMKFKKGMMHPPAPKLKLPPLPALPSFGKKCPPPPAPPVESPPYVSPSPVYESPPYSPSPVYKSPPPY